MDKAGRRVSRLSVSVGEDVSGAETLLLECDRKPPSVVARVDEDGAERLRVGDKATITDEASNNTVEARVKTIARSSKSGAEADATGRPVTLVAAGGSTLSGLPDDVRVTITSAVAAEPVLTVPVSAVYTDELGASRVVLANGDERGATVDVTLGPCVSGWCQILDSGSEELIEGAAVVVGERAGK
jgi:hypothetical protein